MQNTFSNLPGIYAYKDDGNLRILETIPGNVTLIVGTAPSGPMGAYFVRDTKTAETTFDPDGTGKGTLLKKMYEVLSAGKGQYIVLYRLGAEPVALDFINGHTIVSSNANSDANDAYQIYYNANDNGEEVIRIFDKISGAIVYDNIAGINLAGFNVYGDKILAAESIGTSSVPVDFEDLKNFTTSPAIGDKYVINLTTATNQGSVVDAPTGLFKAGALVQISDTEKSTEPTNDGSNGYYRIEYVDGSDIYFEGKYSYSNGAITKETFTGFTSADLVGKIALKPLFIEAKDGLSLTLNQLYAKLANIYWDLEAAKIDRIEVADIKLNAPNVVDNEGRYATSGEKQEGYVAPSGDFLGKAYEFEHNGKLWYAFKNSFYDITTDKTASEIPSPYELGIDGLIARAFLSKTSKFDSALITDDGAATDDITYHEINFGYQLAKFLHELSMNDNEASASIEMVPPKYSDPNSVRLYLGQLPTYDATGKMLRSGKGILGYKFMSGSLNVGKGFFATVDGQLDSTKVLDRNNMPIDLGKYLDVIATPLLYRNNYKNTTTGYVTGGGALYSGLIMTLPMHESAINKTVASDNGSVTPWFSLKKLYLDQLTSVGYVCFSTDSNGNTFVVDAPTMALNTSDWKRRIVNRVAGYIIEELRAVASPFIGKINSAEMINAVEIKMNKRLKELAVGTEALLTFGSASVRSTRDMQLRGEAVAQVQIQTAPELRKLTMYVGLMK